MKSRLYIIISSYFFVFLFFNSCQSKGSIDDDLYYTMADQKFYSDLYIITVKHIKESLEKADMENAAWDWYTCKMIIQRKEADFKKIPVPEMPDPEDNIDRSYTFSYKDIADGIITLKETEKEVEKIFLDHIEIEYKKDLAEEMDKNNIRFKSLQESYHDALYGLTKKYFDAYYAYSQKGTEKELMLQAELIMFSMNDVKDHYKSMYNFRDTEKKDFERYINLQGVIAVMKNMFEEGFNKNIDEIIIELRKRHRRENEN